MEAFEDLKSIGKEEKSGYAARMLYDIYSGDSRIPPNKGLAREYLEYAVSCGDEDAMIILESIYSNEHSKVRELKELKNTIANTFASKNYIYFAQAGNYAYECKDYVSAAEWFVKGVKTGQFMCGNNLACMIRRGEADELKLSVDVMALLENVLAKATSNCDRALANLNIALNRILGCACDRNDLDAYKILNELARDLELFRSVAEWWLDLAKYGDQEGCLVALILYSFGAFPEKNNLNLNKCYETAKSYSLPDWIRVPTNCSQVSK
jgi:TPR repeat protein